ncbi:FtsX-like permease family protein [Stenotrophomonas sp. SY1]|jgi:putative ABC transport system permease protein|uniref:ABC transporter permease n=1 Tax=Stenotrophomonas sp. SY1 TaxID=477235 RepID=UPI001E3930FB|nr:FtsX-like permease family protein [Stenotrophomonas sp. SY1]MCD9085798.1 FtsX-like permease family protein [Stenotrophomonas sp. SY1]
MNHLLSPLRRHPMMPWLIVLQIAVACAILCNTLFLLAQQATPLLIDDGIARGEVIIVDQLVNRGGNWNAAQARAGADALAGIAGVQRASAVVGAPMRQTLTMVYDIKSANGPTLQVSGYIGERLIDTLGLQLSRGRDFQDDEYSDLQLGDGGGSASVPVVITEALARALFGDANPVGQALTGGDGSGHYVVVGVVAHLMRYQLSELDDGKAEYAMLLPQRAAGLPMLSFLVRSDAAQRDAVLKAVPGVLKHTYGGQIATGFEPLVADYEQLRAEALGSRRAAVWLLLTVNAVIATITLIGIASLSGYWIQQRTRQIGIRRALGATRAQILRHFLAENLLLTISGVVAGLTLAVLINQWLMQHYELPRLPWIYLPVAALLLVLLGQAAVAAPARRAARLPPASATRNV